MSISLTGMSSGLDTESMITELMSAYSTKKDNLVKKNTRYSWKMDAWKEMNTKINTFYSKSLSGMRFSTAYKAKKTTVSDTTKASVTASNSAVTGTQTLAVKQLAQAGYLTGATVSKADGSTAKASTTLGELGYNGSSSMTVKVGSQTKTIKLTSDMKISEVAAKLSDAGINASFDAKNQRMFLSAKSSGKAGDFSITADSDDAVMAMSALGIYEGSDSEVEEMAAQYGVVKGENGKYSVDTTSSAYLQALADKQTELEGKYQILIDAANQAVADAQSAKETAESDKAAQQALLGVDENGDRIEGAGGLYDQYEASAGYQKALEIMNGEDFDASAYGITDSDDEAAKVSKIMEKRLADLNAIPEEERTQDQKDELAAYEETADIKSRIDDAESAITAADKTIASSDATITSKQAEVDSNQALYDSAADEAKTLVDSTASAAANNLNKSAGAKAVRIAGQDAEIYLNGAYFSSTSNAFEINGLTINVTGTTGLTEDGKSKSADELGADDYNTVQLTTDVDVDAIYSSIKSFLTGYNELIKEMDTQYGADDASDYDPLTDEEKDAMTDTEVEAWETKIKDSLLRRDDTLNEVINTLKTGMSKSYTIDGEKVSLGTFGIETLSYFLSGDNEKGMYHIDGDSEDSDTSANEDKLKKAISTDPEKVQKFFTQLATDLYSSLSKKMQTTSMSSSMTVYNDKEMKSTYSKYLTDLSDYEDKLNDIEDRYRSQFSSMETALTTLQSSTSAISSLLG